MMQFDEAGTIVVPVRWYFCQEGAQPLPYSHLYVSSNWQTVPRQSVGIGERWDAARPWSNGKPPNGATGTRKPCGPQDWWQNGVPTGSPPLKLDNNLLGACCTGSSGGIMIGGGHDQPCIPLPDSAKVFVRTSIDPVFVLAPHVATGRWEKDYTDGIKVFLDSLTPVNPFHCLAHVSADYFVGSLHTDREARRVSYTPSTDTSLWVVPPGLPTSPIDNMWIEIHIVGKLFITTGGLKIGGQGTLSRYTFHGQGGLLLGGSQIHVVRRLGTGGLKIGGSSTRREFLLKSGNGGIEVGASSSGKRHYIGNGGIEVGATSAVKLKANLTGGIKPGGSNTHNSGISQLCCPGHAIPTTLFATAGHKFTATWDATNQWWAWIDTDVVHGFHLQCRLVGATWTWQIRAAAQAGCTSSSTINSQSCGPPLALNITCHVTGGSCIIAGDYTYAITET